MAQPTTGADTLGTVIDSNILIDLERGGRLRDRDLFAHLPNDGLIAAITFSEIAVGFELADSPARRAERELFLNQVIRRFPVLPFGEAEARAYARCYAALRRMGQLTGLADLQIAATAIAGGHRVLTENRAEFERIPGIRLVPATS